ncbi:hypothetical protein GCM10023185_00570 [Hymenobacter saemangeumensis]|uniref:DUF305 domain-containing protein n=1 Tax=Hymenobacter saemangeumensis TaxID=1084522 RepID=A0ABP8HWM4_9BACT
MKAPFFLSLALAASLLSSCGEQKPIRESNEPASAETEATIDSAHQHHMEHGAGAAAGSSLTGAMAKMMQDMHDFKANGNTDHDFAHMMMAHHQGAVEMSEVLLREGKDPALKGIAQKILDDQKQEISALNAAAERLDAAAKNYEPTNASDKYQQRMTASMKVMMQPVTPTGDVDKDYALMMIPHHQSAVDMAQAVIDLGKDAQVKKMAQTMIQEQKKEIAQFQAWLKQHGGDQAAQATSAVYECPMACEGSKSTKPGKCPVCGMNLEKKG